MTSAAHSPNSTSSHQARYDQDFVAWAEATAQLLKQRRFDEIDLESLTEEVQDLARRDKQQLQSRLSELLLHLLKWQYQPERRSYPGTNHNWNENSWARSIDNQRNEIKDLLEYSPSLSNFLSDSINKCYGRARKGAQRDTRLPIATFPEHCPYTETQILDDEFWPD